MLKPNSGPNVEASVASKADSSTTAGITKLYHYYFYKSFLSLPHMRSILAIWTFYLMVLALLPCSDAKNQCYDDAAAVITTQTHDHDKDSDDGCSPSCYCNCCSASITSFDFKMPELKQPKLQFAAQTITLRDCSFISRYDGNIWNPPKFTV